MQISYQFAIFNNEIQPPVSLGTGAAAASSAQCIINYHFYYSPALEEVGPSHKHVKCMTNQNTNVGSRTHLHRYQKGSYIDTVFGCVHVRDALIYACVPFRSARTHRACSVRWNTRSRDNGGLTIYQG